MRTKNACGKGRITVDQWLTATLCSLSVYAICANTRAQAYFGSTKRIWRGSLNSVEIRIVQQAL
jgi:hypothetical protein